MVVKTIPVGGYVESYALAHQTASYCYLFGDSPDNKVAAF
jgi:hypothetical protein